MMASLEKEQPQKGTEHLSEVEEKDATAEGTHLEEQHLVDEDHFNDIHSKPVVQFGSRVRIHHSGTSTLLTSPDAKYNGGSLEQVVGCTTDEAGQEQVFEIIPSDSNHKQGDVLLHGQPFSIKHVNSGLLLFCDANLKSPVTEQAEVSCRSDANEYSTWKIDTDETEILFEQGVTITNVGTGLKLQSGGFSFEAKDGLEVNEVSCSDSGEDWMLIKV
jgi:dolichyl-phosphate-mannose--protein O-mannosyl transferase